MLKKLILTFTIVLIQHFVFSENKRVLLISSYNSEFPTFYQQINGIKSVLDPVAQISLEFMDSKRFVEEKNTELFTQYLSYKLAHSTKYDAIISTDDNALDFVLKNQNSLFKNIPIVFCGVNNIRKALDQNTNPWVTGTIESVSLEETVEIMVRLFPHSKKLYAISDNTSSGQGDLKKYYQLAADMPEFEFLEILTHKMNFEEYKTQLRRIPEDVPVLLLSAYHDSKQTTITFEETMQLLKENLKAPLFHLWEHGMGEGVLGGKIISHYEQGKTAANMLQKIWQGADLSSLKVVNQSPNVILFDYKQLQRFGLSERNLPKESMLLNKPETFISKNKELVQTTIFIFILLIGFIIILSRNILKRQKIEQALIQQNKQYEKLNEEYKYQNKQINAAKQLAEENEVRFRHLFENNPVSLWEEDFSGVKKLLEQLPCRIENLESYLNENPDFVTECARAIKINKINQATLDLFEFDNKEELIRNFSKIFNDNSFTVFKQLLMAIAKDKLRITLETEFINRSGQTIYAILNVFTFDDFTKSIVAIIDTTKIKLTKQNLASKIMELQQSEHELKKTNKELVLAKEQAEESEQLKSAFLANMSHEIRTPMNGILGFTELLSEPQLSGKEKQNYIAIIKKSGQRMLDTINDIIDISKIHAKQVQINYSLINLQDELNTLFEFFKPEADSKKLQFTFDVQIPPGCEKVSTDQNKLYSILSNLIKNAIKYTEKGSIKINAVLEEKVFSFSVKDTGIGIPANRLSAIFQRFVQADLSDVRALEGAGLGLAITQSYAEMLGGEILVKSTVGKGTEFTVKLPFLMQPNDEAQSPHRQKNNNNTSKKLKILIAEDDDISYIHLELLLKEQAVQVYRAKNGEEAIHMVKNNPKIDLVLMDIKMPGTNGIEATKQIRLFNKQLPIIGQSAYALSGDKAKALSAGCNGYITKPIDKEQLIKLIEVSIS